LQAQGTSGIFAMRASFLFYAGPMPPLSQEMMTASYREPLKSLNRSKWVSL
jgi:hypothetical protein